MVFICLLIALILFVVAGLGASAGRFNLLAFGLAFLALAMLWPALPV